MKFSNPFSMDETIHSYWYPIIKIIICLFILVIWFLINRIFADQSNLLQLLMTIISLIVCLCSILAIEVSICEIISIQDRSNDKKEQLHSSDYKTVDASIDQILDLFKNNDCMDIKLLFDSKIVHIGVASDNNVKDNIFFNKVYYIENEEFETLKPFEDALVRLKHSEKHLKIIEIDDLSPQEYSMFK